MPAEQCGSHHLTRGGGGSHKLLDVNSLKPAQTCCVKQPPNTHSASHYQHKLILSTTRSYGRRLDSRVLGKHTVRDGSWSLQLCTTLTGGLLSPYQAPSRALNFPTALSPLCPLWLPTGNFTVASILCYSAHVLPTVLL